MDAGGGAARGGERETAQGQPHWACLHDWRLSPTFFSKETVLFIERGPGKSWFGRSKVTFLPNQERLLPYCLPAQEERESSCPWLSSTLRFSSVEGVCLLLCLQHFSPVFLYQRRNISIQPCPDACTASSPARRWSVPTMGLFAPYPWCPTRLLPP